MQNVIHFEWLLATVEINRNGAVIAYQVNSYVQLILLAYFDMSMKKPYNN